MSKHEWKKQEKTLYIPRNEPELIQVPAQKFFAIYGKGNPNSEDFGERVSALFPLSYALRGMPKQGYTPEGYFEYTVYPLEGIWDLDAESENHASIDKENLIYTIMIRQPDFVTQELFKMALATTKKKKPSPFLDDVFMKEYEDGLSVQMMHYGSYDDEPGSFAQMTEFISHNKLKRTQSAHREIYIADSKRYAPAKMRTVLRYFNLEAL